MVAQATSVADGASLGAEPGPVHPYVEALTGLPGVEHVAVVDISGQRVLAEWGGPEGSSDALLGRAREAAARTGRRELEDIVSTTPSAIHLSRLVLAGPGHPESVWVGLRVDRAQGSLPWSRAALAGLDGPTAFPAVPRIPAQRGAPVDGPGRAVPGPRIVPPPPAPAAAPAPAPAVAVLPADPGPPKVRVALTARLSAPAPVAPQESDTGTAQTVETMVAEVAITTEIARPTLPEPPAPSGTVVLEPARSSSFAPVMVVLPPPSPVPDDGTTEEPAPMPYPIIIAPDPAAEELTADDDPEDTRPATDQPPPAPSPSDDAAEDTDEPRVVRRLIQGLRRRP